MEWEQSKNSLGTTFLQLGSVRNFPLPQEKMEGMVRQLLNSRKKIKNYLSIKYLDQMVKTVF